MTSMSDGSSSTIMVEEWQPIFDRFDLESDGRMVGIREGVRMKKNVFKRALPI